MPDTLYPGDDSYSGWSLRAWLLSHRFGIPARIGIVDFMQAEVVAQQEPHLMETGGRVFGFCNAFCRDKTAADPEAWPTFVPLRDGA